MISISYDDLWWQTIWVLIFSKEALNFIVTLSRDSGVARDHENMTKVVWNQNSTLMSVFFFLIQRSELMLNVGLTWIDGFNIISRPPPPLHRISCFKSESNPRGRLYFSSFVSSLSLSEREGGSNSHEGDGDRGVGCWQSAKARKCCTVWPQT